MNELKHYGILGMKWGHKRASKYSDKATKARESAKEWEEMSKLAVSKGNHKKADKYSRYAADDRKDASSYSALSSHSKALRSKVKKKMSSAAKKQKVKDISRETVIYGAQVALRMLQNSATNTRIRYWTGDSY